MKTGHYFVLMSLQVWQIAGVKNLNNCTLVMKDRYTWAETAKLPTYNKAKLGIQYA